ncbi:single-stranded-DNA-specific exonuclease RecJ [Desulfuromonas acetoxidans]|uniref:Single-stranded-DNA-specific exonuclease RecJ n=1 Tax=Desulfuromonas acetoxidans (strain DSM 684 / 11070) TaxID=281689 RepID=Q1K1E0_DESA6|nr:single-stranded-DNA-specific exonuclease RecJ [Desulfuromonas acetoxidans]EAT16448.1 single-stranded-DNA-specific exonuclease RecJ [Desulfuromonas acetoxidans DSM 684]MBF0644394.1 single-stranded-DNA-specific exonuclease RecJ [Desulfuromonas acetoxidans]NVD23588.1 single-stranded-DNA-specific exonuclease RecJ [Desulfuromonas acetoxidans]NVE16027.1 single-stranded-DNA-specific exonuclease RecJ [Desulfuromonas acetoxidans]
MQPSQQRSWKERQSAKPVDWQQWSARLGCAPLVCQLLSQRGISTLEEAQAFLTASLSQLPDPMALRGMESAVDRLVQAVKAGEPIAVHGDYDVDGISGTALLTQCLRWFGVNVTYHIPLRMRDGYGLSEVALRRTLEQGIRLVVSVDCGISAHAEAQLAADLGIELIITDHHQPPETLPVSLSCINPWLPDCSYPDKRLSGVGVAFMVMIALRARLRETGNLPDPEPDLRYVLDLVALGTVADLVPLQGVNRALVSSGLRLMAQQPRVGLAALVKVAEVRAVTAGVVGYQLAPRLNAAGRLEDATLGVDLLLDEVSQSAMPVAEQLNQFNHQRRQIEQQVLDQAIERIERDLTDDALTIVLADERWHAGVIGIVASRLVERYHRPTVLIALEEGQGKGSARSIKGFHLYQAFEACQEPLSGFGGHEFAAGLSIDAACVSRFTEQFERYAQSHLNPVMLGAVREYDAELVLEEIDETLYDELQALAPFGMGNPEPVFVVRQVHVHRPSCVAEKHLRFSLQQDGYSVPCIAFGMAQRQDEVVGQAVDVLFQVGMNTWRGQKSLQLIVKDIMPSHVEGA